jgi:hypothetical protein
VVYRRPADYVERRGDGYREPELIWLLGTAHVSATSAAEVTAVVQVRQGTGGREGEVTGPGVVVGFNN